MSTNQQNQNDFSQQQNQNSYSQQQQHFYQKFCHSCGKSVVPRAEICMNCGVRQHTIIPGGKSRIAAGILGILLGGFGVHKFYMGKVGLGVLYLVFFWSLIPWIVGFIEGIIYLCESDENFAQRLNVV